jgi:hypothetical protein
MPKLLKNILETYPPRSRDEKLFVDQHKVDKIKNKGVGTEDDKLFNATNIKQVSRRADRHGYEPGEDLDKYDAGRATAPGTMKSQRGVGNIPPTTTYEAEEKWIRKDNVEPGEKAPEGVRYYTAPKKKKSFFDKHWNKNVIKRMKEDTERQEDAVDEGHSIKQLAQAADAHRLHRNAYLTQSQRKYQKGKDGGDDAAAAGKHDKAVQVADRLRWKLQDKGKTHTSQLKKEDIEQVDEISNKLLSRYVPKAINNAALMASGKAAYHRLRPNADGTPFDKAAENRDNGINLAFRKAAGLAKVSSKSKIKEDAEQVDEAGFANKFAPLKKTQPRSGYMRLKGGGVGYDSSNPDMRINRRAGLDKDIDWENDGKGAFDKQQKRMEKFKNRALKKEDEEILENIEEHMALLSIAEEMLNEDVTSALSPYYQSPEYHKDRASTHSLHCSDCNSLAQQHINLMDQATDRAVKNKHRSIAKQYSELAKAHAHMTDHHYNEFRKARNKMLRSK